MYTIIETSRLRTYLMCWQQHQYPNDTTLQIEKRVSDIMEDIASGSKSSDITVTDKYCVIVDVPSIRNILGTILHGINPGASIRTLSRYMYLKKDVVSSIDVRVVHVVVDSPYSKQYDARQYTELWLALSDKNRDATLERIKNELMQYAYFKSRTYFTITAIPKRVDDQHSFKLVYNM